MAGVDARSSAAGRIGQLGGRKTLSVLNAVFNISQYWDGRVSGLKEHVVNSVMANPAAMFKSRGAGRSCSTRPISTPRASAPSTS